MSDDQDIVIAVNDGICESDGSPLGYHGVVSDVDTTSHSLSSVEVCLRPSSQHALGVAPSQGSGPGRRGSSDAIPGSGLRRSQRSKRVQTPSAQTSGHGQAQSKVSKRGRQQGKSPGQFPSKEWVVEKILDAGIDSETLEHSYLVKWEGCAIDESTWEPKKNLTGCRDAVRHFEETRPAYNN